MKRLLLATIALLAFGLAVVGAYRPVIEDIVVCREVREEGHRYVPEGRTTEFTPNDAFVHCVVEVWIPSEYDRASVTLAVTWYAPDGSVFQVDRFYRLRKGVTYTLQASLPVRGNEAAELLGKWRVCAAASGRAARCAVFSICKPEAVSPRTGAELKPADELFIPYDEEGAIRLDLVLLNGDRSVIVEAVQWDTGADISHLPAWVAEGLSIDLHTGRKVNVVGVEGRPIEAWLHYVQVKLVYQGKCLANGQGECAVLWIPVLFDERPNAVKLLGRSGIVGYVRFEMKEEGALLQLVE